MTSQNGASSPRPKGKSKPILQTAIEHCTAQLFLISQGTGLLAVCIHQLDWQFDGTQIIGTIVWLLTITLFVLFLACYLAKIFIFPKQVKQDFTTNIIELCTLASISITFGGIIEMVAFVCGQDWGESWGIVAYVLAWMNVALAFTTCVGIPYVYMWCICPGIDGMPPAVLLPAIAAVTAASACGAVTFAGQISSRLQVPMIIVGYVLLGLGIPLALSLIGIFIARLLNGEWPPRAKAPLTYVLVGPLGQGAYALQLLGASAGGPGLGAFGTYNKGRFITDSAGKIVQTVSILAALILWGYGAFWMLFCLAESVHLGLFRGGGLKNRGYSLAMWSPVFPVGVFTAAAIEFGKLMDAPAWNALSSGFVIILFCLWLVNAALSLKLLFSKVSGEWKQESNSGDGNEK